MEKINFSVKVPSKRPLKLADAGRGSLRRLQVTGKHNGVGVDSSGTPKADKDGFMEAPDGEVPFD